MLMKFYFSRTTPTPTPKVSYNSQIVLTRAYFVVQKSDYSDASLLWLMTLCHRFSRAIRSEICGPRRHSSISCCKPRRSTCNHIFSTYWRMPPFRRQHCPVDMVSTSLCSPWACCWIWSFLFHAGQRARYLWPITTLKRFWGFRDVQPSICKFRKHYEYYILTTRDLQTFDDHYYNVRLSIGTKNIMAK